MALKPPMPIGVMVASAPPAIITSASPRCIQRTASPIACALEEQALVCAKLGALVGRLRLPAVLGELLAGMVLGNLVLLGLGFGKLIEADAVVQFLAQLGAVILLFQLGLESSVSSMRRVGARAFWVAIIGVALPFVLGTYVVGPWLLPDMPFAAYLFLAINP